jgi:hypothetical protein
MSDKNINPWTPPSDGIVSNENGKDKKIDFTPPSDGGS